MKTYSIKLTKIQLNILKAALRVYIDSNELKKVCPDCEKRLISIVSQIKEVEEVRRKNVSTN